MAALTKSDDEDDAVTDPMKILLQPEDDNENISPTPISQEQNQQHHLTSIDSTVIIRQLHSQGLSFQLWPAATTLVTLLDYHRDLRHEKSPLSSILASKSNPDRPLRILELGSGTGLVGIAAAVLLSADVTVTDLPHVISNLQFNVDANAELLKRHGGVVHVASLRWGEDDDVECLGKDCFDFDIVMASDVVYYDELYDPLLKTLRFLLLKKESVFVMAHLRRWKKDSAFFKRAKKVFDVETLHVDSPCDGARTGVVVYSFAGKKQKN